MHIIQTMAALTIRTKEEGRLGASSPEDIRIVAQSIATSEQAVIHVHGGLVSQASALAAAERLDVYYRAAGIVPVFPIWKSGIFETLEGHWRNIFNERLFEILLEALLKHAGGILLQAPGDRDTNDYVPLTDLRVRLAIEQARAAEANDTVPEPLKEIEPQAPPLPPEQGLAKTLKKELNDSTNLQKTVDSIMVGLGADVPEGSRDVAAQLRPQNSLISESIKSELLANVSQGDRGAFSPLVIVIHATKVLYRVIERFSKATDHGLYTTVVEELLREFYLGTAGAWFWDQMKGDTEGAFEDNIKDDLRGGCCFMFELGKQLKQRVDGGRSLPRISIVAHSAGSIWASNFLIYLSKCRATGIISKSFAIDRLILLAPACTYTSFYKVLSLHSDTPLFKEFRLFALDDKLEGGYWEAPPLYPKSLLYMVSGLFEGEADEALLGMQRFINRPQTNRTIRDYLSTPPGRAVWSVVDGGPGRGSDALRHGAFQETDKAKPIQTMESVIYFLRN